jgi:hypothetical protein
MTSSQPGKTLYRPIATKTRISRMSSDFEHVCGSFRKEFSMCLNMMTSRVRAASP